MSDNIFNNSIEYLKGVGPQRAELLNKELGIFSFGDLIKFYPFRYIDRSKYHKIADIAKNENVYLQIIGKLGALEIIGNKRANRLKAHFYDDTGKVELVWFKGITWLRKSLKSGENYILFGKPNNFKGIFNFPHPELEPITDADKNINPLKLQPVYNSTEKLKAKGLHSRNIGKLISSLLPLISNKVYENLAPQIVDELKLLTREQALINIHFPSDSKLLDKALFRLKFEELFFIQLKLLRLKKSRDTEIKGYEFERIGEKFNTFYKKYLPFELTNAQKKVVKEIRHDVGSGKQMNRLLQGDVGSGKTIVALLTILIAIDNGFQACMMAPTEILAKQHYKTLSKLIEGLELNVDILIGSTKKSVRKELLENLANGKTNILVGTHALIEDSVVFSNLGLVIIDEQHRFGVAQRAKLWKKNTTPPHVLVMTATPIPRTLAMTLYGDLSFSVINELPPGRKPIKTIHKFDKDRLNVFGFMKEQIALGRQIYVVYPLIEESAKLDLKDLMDGYESLSREFPLPEYAISVLHGKMKPQDKDYEMQRFLRKETQIMVSTTVIEVGVDVPNATVMVIENSERFGLSQLHQLRGRVGRGGEQSFCILMSGYKLTEDAKKRLHVMVSTNDGFIIAEEDLKLRGPGDLEGTQQSGIVDLKLANLAKDEMILKKARYIASKIIDEDPKLDKPENLVMKKYLTALEKGKPNWSRIS